MKWADGGRPSACGWLGLHALAAPNAPSPLVAPRSYHDNTHGQWSDTAYLVAIVQALGEAFSVSKRWPAEPGAGAARPGLDDAQLGTTAALPARHGHR